MLLRPATMSFKWLFEATYLNFGEDKKKKTSGNQGRDKDEEW